MSVIKSLKIVAENSVAIEAALHAVNGRSVEHAFSTYSEIEWLSEKAEKALTGLLYKKDFAGAEWFEVSGKKVANCYKDSRNATSVRITRRSGAWYLTSVAQTSIGNDGGHGYLRLTESQDMAAKAEFAKGYSVIKPSLQ